MSAILKRFATEASSEALHLAEVREYFERAVDAFPSTAMYYEEPFQVDDTLAVSPQAEGMFAARAVQSQSGLRRGHKTDEPTVVEVLCWSAVLTHFHNARKRKHELLQRVAAAQLRAADTVARAASAGESASGPRMWMDQL